MTSLSDIYSSILSGTAVVSKLTLAVPKPGGNFTAVNFISSTPTQVIAASSARTNITFHNPNVPTGTVTATLPIFVAPLTANSTFSGSFSPSIGFNGGTIAVLPGAWITLTMTGQGANSINGAWVAFVSSGSNWSFTIMDQ